MKYLHETIFWVAVASVGFMVWVVFLDFIRTTFIKF
jgi:hypothetical protein